MNEQRAAYQLDGAPCTRERFYAVACDPRRSVVVEACAGAGKTWMLVSRMLRALLDGCAPHEILAITFTRKAAGEMRERLTQWLQDFARPRAATPDGGKPAETEAQWQARLLDELVARGIEPQRAPVLREKLQNLYQTLLAHGRPVQIRTFHGWFAALLQTAPLSVLDELGLPVAHELLEDDAQAVAEVWRPFLREVAGDETLRADYGALVLALGRTRAHDALAGALARRTEFGLADAAGRLQDAVPDFDVVYPRMAGVARPADWLLLRESGRELLRAAARALLGASAKTFVACGEQLLAALQAGDFEAARAALFTRTGEARKFSDKVAGLQQVRAAQEEVLAVLAAEQQRQARLHQQRMCRLTRVLIACFARLKRERGWVDMNDVESAAMRLLADHALSAWVQQRLDVRTRHLLVDEFQDTNPLQWQALHAWLSGYAGAGGGHSPPSVFIVGDPKQSIYRFRRADPKVFSAARDFVVQALGGVWLATDHTRRNARGVLALVNGVMQAAQQASEFSDYRAHTTESDGAGDALALPLVPRSPKAAKGAAEPESWRDSLTTARLEEEETLRTLECRQAARWIAARIAAGVAPKEIMVLARKREPLGVLQAELRRLGVACEQPEKNLLAEQPAVRDVLALVDALISPGHDLMLARALKSPLFGCSDEDLARLALAVRAAGEARPCWLDVLSKVELETLDGQALTADLAIYRGWLLSLPPHDALQAIYQHRDVLARFYAAAPAAEGAQVLRQLRALLSAALSVQGGRFLTAYQWLRVLRRERIALPAQAAPEAVRLLTVHGAKGLEADEVLLLDSASTRTSRGEPEVLIDWPGDAPLPTRLVFLAKGSSPPASEQGLADQEAAAQAREELNALYVAMTRARARLVLSGFAPHQSACGSWWQRMEALAQPLPAPPETAPASSSVPSLTLLALPPLALEEGRGEGCLHEENQLAAPAAQALPAIQSEASADSDASRIGQAMHWLLEHAGEAQGGWLPERVLLARQRFALCAAQMQQAEAMARRILGGAAAWAWSTEEVLEAFNEVELVHAGQRLRIDRLVRRRAGTHGCEGWWVLDYKSAARPEREAPLQAQLAGYRAAVERLYPGAAVRVAFLSGDGREIVLP
ncbi:exodeoxyribonuclease V subunit beta [Comamonas sp. NLF-1-9]|uniref:UvrD-helicase domain-containing protein n=1 Tax=Comamonas sp. NLF-1-9 TaxID=2853163 RepID=UPI001C4916AB|nr:UvrD-helicase domain-containing protein [Comamonas sp. NLF-1-9]QXL83244.1 UvrD-helicase domain-containing protein [Comamonas sp. NLF-1-9]